MGDSPASSRVGRHPDGGGAPGLAPVPPGAGSWAPSRWVGLVGLDVLRLLRAWRWRALALVTVVACYFLSRLGGFGEGAAGAFPGGILGLRVMALVLVAGAVLLAVDLAGQLDRFRMREMVESRPAGGLLVQSSRLAAIAACTLALACYAAVVPFVAPSGRGAGLMAAPSVMFLGLVAAPLVIAAASAGLLGRCLFRSDAAGVAAGGLFAAPAVMVRLFASEPERLFLSASPSLGVLEPTPVLVRDAAAAAGYGVLLLGVAALAFRRVPQRTALRSVDPPRRSFAPSIRGGVAMAVGGARRAGTGTLAAVGIAAAGAWAAAPLLGESASMAMGQHRVAPEVDWRVLRSPRGADGGVVPPPRITGRQIDVSGAGTVEVTLGLGAATQEPADVVAVTFGPVLDIAGVTRPRGSVVVLQDDSPASQAIRFLAFDPPLEPGTTEPVTFRLEPRRWAWRDWARTRHPVYATFAAVPLWYGEGVLVDFPALEVRVTEQAAPYRIEAPAVAPRRWLSGSAEVAEGPGGAVVTQERPGRPESLTAAPFVIVDNTPQRALDPSYDVRFAVFPEHEYLAGQLHVAFAVRLARLYRALGPHGEPIIVAAAAAADVSDPLAIPAAQLDRLDTLLVDYDNPDEPTAGEFDQLYGRIQSGAMREIWRSRFAGFEDPALLRDAFLDYMEEWGFLRGNTRHLAGLRRDFVLVPWEVLGVAAWDTRPFDVRASDAARYDGPVDPQARPDVLPPVAPQRLRGVYHMLRGLMGDRAFLDMVRILGEERGGEWLGVADLRAAAAAAHGEPLDWFFDQWLDQGVLPQYRLRSVQVEQVRNAASRRIEYRTNVVVANDGSGRMPVEVVVGTDGDRAIEVVEIGPAEEIGLEFRTGERPVVVEVDPQGWVVQSPEYDSRARSVRRPQLFVTTIKPLGPE